MRKILCLLLLAAGCGQTPSSNLKDNIDANSSDFVLGRGYDAVTGKALGDCVVTTDPGPAWNSSGSITQITIKRIDSSVSLLESLGISAQAKYNGMVANVAGKVSIFNETSVNKQSLFLLIHVKVINPVYSMRNVQLSQDAINVFNAQRPEAFRRKCGDHFIRSQILGGELVGVLEIQTKDETHKKQLDASLSATYGSFSSSADLQTKMQNVIKNNNIQLNFYQAGGPLEELDPTPASFLEIAKKFPPKVQANNARAIFAVTAPYDTILNFPAGPSQVDVSTQVSYLQELARQDLEYGDALKTIEHVLANPNEYLNPDLASLSNAAKQIKYLLNQVRNAARTCTANYKSCSHPDFDYPAFLLPSRDPSKVPDGSDELSLVKYEIYKGYRTCYGRLPEASGYAAWLNAAKTQGYSAVLATLCFQPEADTITAQRNVIQTAYNDCYDRDPEAGAIDAWMTGVPVYTPQKLYQYVCTQPEGDTPGLRERVVTRHYLRCLGRTPDAAAQSLWAKYGKEVGTHLMIDGICKQKEALARL